MEQFSQMIATALKLPVHRVENTLNCFREVLQYLYKPLPKEATGGLDEVQIGDIHTRYEKLYELAKRKETVLSTIEEQGKLTDTLRERISNCWDATELEDIYLPFKPKRKTRADCTPEGTGTACHATIDAAGKQLICRVRQFVKGDVKDEEDALKGARDIIAEQVNEDERARNLIRNQFSRQAMITSKVVKGKEKEEAALKYRDYFDFSEPLKKCTSHRLLAIRRGETEVS